MSIVKSRYRNMLFGMLVTALCTTLFLGVYHSTFAETLSGGNYTLNGDITALSESTGQTGGVFSVSSRSDSVGGALSGGNFSMNINTPGVSDTTVSSSATEGGGGGTLSQRTLSISALSVAPSADGAVVTVTFTEDVQVVMRYGVDAPIHTTPQSAVGSTHTFTLAQLQPAARYVFSFDVVYTVSAVGNLTQNILFGPFGFDTLHTEPSTPILFTATTTESFVSIDAHVPGSTVPVVPYNEAFDAHTGDNVSEEVREIERVLLRGVVRDVAGDPITDAEIQLFLELAEGAGVQEVDALHTNKRGEYMLYAPVGEYVIVARHAQYAPLTTEARLVSGEAIVDVILNRASIQATTADTTYPNTDCSKTPPLLMVVFVVFLIVFFGMLKLQRKDQYWKTFATTSLICSVFALMLYLSWCRF